MSESTQARPPLTAQALEAMLQAERGRQAEQVSTLEKLRTRNGELQGALATDLGRLGDLSRSLEAPEDEGFWDKVRGFFDFLPGVEKAAPRRSIEALLREQFATSQARLAEASAFADRLEAAQADLYDEVERLNGQLIDAAQQAERAAERVLVLERQRADLEARVLEGGRTVEAELDRTRRAQAEAAVQLKLFETADERLGRLKAHTVALAETVAHLQSDILRYVLAAGAQLDLVGGQINAVGAAADAAVVTLELKKALDGLTRTLDESTRFVSETQRYFRENVDGLIADLGRFDAKTTAVLEQNLAFAQASDELRVEAALESARRRR